jgi:di/tripeptidase
MTRDKINRLSEVLKIQTHSRQEHRMVEYLVAVCTEKGFTVDVDKHMNVYVTKGEADWYPCFVSHTDTVHKINSNMVVIETKTDDDRTLLTGMDSQTGRPSGIGGDDKCGVYLCLEMLDTLDNVKAAFFVSEEIGCLGSKHADPEFFSNVGYAIQYDSPEGDSMSYTLMGDTLFETDGEFCNSVGDLILERGIEKWERHPFTDIWPLMEKFKFSCLNLAAGYYRMHTHSEYVIVEDVQNAFELGIELHERLGESFYPREKEVASSGYGNYSGNTKTTYGSWGGYSTEPKILTEWKINKRKEYLEGFDCLDEDGNISFDDNLLIKKGYEDEGPQNCYWFGYEDTYW